MDTNKKIPKKDEKEIVDTVKMGCPHCKKTTDCVILPYIGKQIPGTIPHSHRYSCTVCKNNWGVQTGGGVDLSSLL